MALQRKGAVRAEGAAPVQSASSFTDDVRHILTVTGAPASRCGGMLERKVAMTAGKRKGSLNSGVVNFRLCSVASLHGWIGCGKMESVAKGSTAAGCWKPGSSPSRCSASLLISPSPCLLL
ncbi:hypothetical protein SEVIR_1G175350v4 [Setaria viridis]